MNNLRKNLQKWLQTENQRLILQRFYLMIIFISLAAASIASLIDQNFGRNIFIITIMTSAIFLINSIIWVLGESISANFLTKKTTKKVAKKRK